MRKELEEYLLRNGWFPDEDGHLVYDVEKAKNITAYGRFLIEMMDQTIKENNRKNRIENFYKDAE